MENSTILSSVLFKMMSDNRPLEMLMGTLVKCPSTLDHSFLFSVSWKPHAFFGFRKLYWSDQGTNSGVPAKIASANMDGTALKILFTGDLSHLEVVTLDIQEQKLYWAVSSRGVVWAAFHCLPTPLWFQMCWVTWEPKIRVFLHVLWTALGLLQCMATFSPERWLLFIPLSFRISNHYLAFGDIDLTC